MENVDGSNLANTTPAKIAETERLYDSLAPKLFKDLTEGGHTSWKGTEAAIKLGEMRDPRAIPGMLNHLKMFPPGHTSAEVGSDLVKICQNPLSKESFDKVVNGLSAIDQRIVKEWLCNPTWVKNYCYHEASIAESVMNANEHMAYWDLLKTFKSVAETNNIKIDEDTFVSFFVSGENALNESDQITKTLIENPSIVAESVVENKISGLKEHTPKIFDIIANPKDGNYLMLPELVAKKLELPQENHTKLIELYKSKELSKGVLARKDFAAGLTFLLAKENGKEILNHILEISQVSRDDPKRIREIFRSLQIIDSGEASNFNFLPSLQETIADLAEKKSIFAQKRMGLSEEDLPNLINRVDALIDDGTLEIIPTLIGHFKDVNMPEVENVVIEVGRHIVAGDFREWRNGLETARKQLSILPEPDQKKWLNPTPEVVVNVNIQTNEELLTSAIKSINRVASEAQAHALEVYKFDFSDERVSHLKITIGDLILRLKSTIIKEEKQELINKKQLLEAELSFIDGIRTLINLENNQFDPKKVIDIVEKTQRAMNSMDGLEQSRNDLSEISKIFTTMETLGPAGYFKAYDTDDPLTLLKVGTEPRETCQSWRQGSVNHCLPAYVTDANKRVVNIESESGQIVARSVIKLTNIRNEDGTNTPAILIEPIYGTTELHQVSRSLLRLVLDKARSINAAVILSKRIDAVSGANNNVTVDVVQQEADRANFDVSNKRAVVFIPQSYNRYEYSDSLGGLISNFDRYENLNEAIILHAKATA